MKGGRRGPTWNSNSRRITEIEIIVRHRHGVVPATDDADLYLIPVALHLRERARKTLVIALKPASARCPEDDQRLEEVTHQELFNWCRTWAPDVSADLIRRSVISACTKKSLPRAQSLARDLRLTYAERQTLGITTIGACDRTKRQRTADYMERKRERDRVRAAQRRKQAGRVSRASWEARSKMRTEPWKALGISRRTYYRRLATGGTGL